MKHFALILSICLLTSLACSLSSNDQNDNENNASVPSQVADNNPPQTQTSTPSTGESVSPTNTPPLDTSCTPRTDWITYTVVRGDTLFSIAQRANSSVSELTTANCLDDPTQISAGQRLYVPNTVSPPDPPRSSDELISIYLIIPNDDGASGIQVGCADSAISVWRDREKTGDTPTDLRASLEELFSIHTEIYGQSGLQHSLADTDVTVNNVSISGGVATIDLSGDFLLIGVCSDARMRAQIVLTIFQYDGINEALVRVNGNNLKQWFDMRGVTGDNEPFYRSEFDFLE